MGAKKWLGAVYKGRCKEGGGGVLNLQPFATRGEGVLDLQQTNDIKTWLSPKLDIAILVAVFFVTFSETNSQNTK